MVVSPTASQVEGRGIESEPEIVPLSFLKFMSEINSKFHELFGERKHREESGAHQKGNLITCVNFPTTHALCVQQWNVYCMSNKVILFSIFILGW